MTEAAEVVVVGGSSGIGEAVAANLLRGGANVTIVGRHAGRLSSAADRLGGAAATATLDASRRDTVDAFFAARSAKLDHLVLSFSSGRAGGPFRDLAIEDLAAAAAGKLVAYLSVLQSALPSMRAAGSVTFVGAVSAEAAMPATVGLAAVNGGLHAAVRPLAIELAPLRINAVAPGIIDTPWWSETPAQVRDGAFENALAAPAGRVGTPDDVADVVALLIGSKYVTGTIVPCDGGLRLR